VKEQCEFKKWYFGHYHMDKDVSDKEVMLYDAIVPIGEEL
jgi:hypothetical protein